VTALMEAHQQGEVAHRRLLRGYQKAQFTDMLNLVDEPGHPPESRTRPPREVLDQIMQRPSRQNPSPW